MNVECVCVCRCDNANLWKLAHFLFHSTMNKIVRFQTIFSLFLSRFLFVFFAIRCGLFSCGDVHIVYNCIHTHTEDRQNRERDREYNIESCWVLNNNKATFKFYSILDCQTISHTQTDAHIYEVVVAVNHFDGSSLLFPFNKNGFYSFMYNVQCTYIYKRIISFQRSFPLFPCGLPLKTLFVFLLFIYLFSSKLVVWQFS